MFLKRILKISYSLLFLVAVIVIVKSLVLFIWVEQGDRYMKDKNYQKAIGKYTLAIKISKQKSVIKNLNRAKSMFNSNRAYKNGLAYLAKKDYEKSYNYFLKVIPEDENYKNAQDKLPSLEELIQIDNDIKRSIGQYKRGLGYYNDNKLEEALECLTTVIIEDPNYLQAQNLISDIRTRLNKDIPKPDEKEVAIVKPAPFVITQPARRAVTGYIAIKPYGYDFGNNFKNYNGIINVDVFIVNSDTASTKLFFNYYLKPGDTNLQPHIFTGKSDYRVKIYYNRRLVEVHNLDYYAR